MRYQLGHIVEYGLLRGTAGLLNLLPYRAALGLAWIFAAFAFHAVQFRRAETFRRIRSVFGTEMPVKRVKRIAWLSLRNMVFNCIEMMRAPTVNRAWVDKHMPGFDAAIPPVLEIVEKYKGAVFTVPHSGNWDLAGWACGLYGVSMFSIAAKQKNPLVNEWINRQREHGTMTILERGGGTLLQIIRLLRTGHVLAILPDVRMKTPDLEVPFLGGTINAGRGMAAFAIAANVPIVPAVFRRIGWTEHTFVRGPTLFPDRSKPREEEERRLTAEVLANVDRAIRETPEQWFWYNKRWVLTPVKKGTNK